MKVMCPDCKSRDISSKEQKGKLQMFCNACGTSFNRIMPEKVTNPVKQSHVYQPPTQPEQRPIVQVGLSYDNPIRSLPTRSGPMSFDQMEGLVSSGRWGIPDGAILNIPQSSLINGAGQMKFVKASPAPRRR